MSQKSAIEILKNKRDRLKVELEKIENLIKEVEHYVNEDKDNPIVKSLHAPDDYDKNWTIPNKLMYVITRSKDGATAKEVAVELCKIDDTLVFERILKRSTVLLSRFNREGVIDSRRIGQSNKYFLKK